MHCSTVRRAAVLTTAAAVTLLLPVAAAVPASAHQRWFVENTDGGDWGFSSHRCQLL